MISRLKFSLPIAKSGKEQLKLEKDEDGDYILQRKNSQDMVEKVIVLGEVDLKEFPICFCLPISSKKFLKIL